MLSWKTGTAVDLFASLYVLHHPAQFGLRGAWAKGVRARLDAAARAMLESVQDLIVVPLAWVSTLPEPGDAVTGLQTLRGMQPEDRFRRLVISPAWPEAACRMVEDLIARPAARETDMAALKATFAGGKTPPEAALRALLTWAPQAATFGVRYLEALETYYHAFFREEEQRIRPALTTAVQQAQALAGQLQLPALLEELSQGVHFPWAAEAQEVILAPSFWMAPLVVWEPLGAGRWMLAFGARPADASLVPGASVPDALLHGLEALASPTRLRILRLLLEHPSTPSELARRLRLRAPTVLHHLGALRLAGLVTLEISPQGERRYAIRQSQLGVLWERLNAFLQPE